MSAVAAACGVSVLTDLAWRRVPNLVTAGTAAVGAVFASRSVSTLDVAASLEGLAVGLLLMLPGYAIGATGGGDVKLLAALGTLLGPSRTAFAFLYTSLAGAVIAAAIAWHRSRRGVRPAQRTFAYAPAIALGALAAALGW